MPSQLWDDLWRIEIETLDNPGNLYLLFEILNNYRVDVVAAEGSINAFGRKHTMSFVIGCHEYHSGRDLTARERIGRARVTLPDLEYLIRLNFGDQLSFADSGYPRVKIKRLAEYWRLANEIRRKSRVAEENSPTRLDAQSIPIDETRIRELLRAGDRELFFTPAVDTKNRLIRLLFFAAGEFAPAHIQVAFTKDITTGIRRMFELLFKMDQNIIKFQVRTGGNQAIQRMSKRRSKSRLARVDLTYEAYRFAGTKGLSTEEITAAISEDGVLKECGLLVCKSHSTEMKMS